MNRDPASWVTVTGLDGSGKSTLLRGLTKELGGYKFRLPYHKLVKDYLRVSGDGLAYGDVHTDRLLFATDARLTNALLREWRKVHPIVLSQRGWMDNFIIGAAQGVGYEEADALLRTSELERPSAIIYLIAEPEVAFGRIAEDSRGDKFETLEFMRKQLRETLRFHESVRGGVGILTPFVGIPEILIDTTAKTRGAVLREVQGFLCRTLSSVRERSS